MVERKNGRGRACSSRGGQGGVWLTVTTGDDFRFGRGRWLHGDGSGVRADAGVWLFFNADQELIGNFPAEVAVLAALLEILFEEDGTAGIGYENT